MKPLLFTVLVLSGCGEVGTITAYYDGSCNSRFLNDATIVKTVEGNKITCSIVFEKTK